MTNIAERHIFLVNDKSDICQVIGEILEPLNLNTSCFTSPTDCLEQLGCQKCHLLITELKMPEMDGIELLRRAKILAPWLPVLIISSYGNIPIAVEAIKAGAVDFIEKPLDKISFAKKVRSILRENGNHTHTYLGKPLTPGEAKVLRLVINGMTNKEIANLLNRSKRTIEVHRANIMCKLGVDNLVDLVKRTAIMGLAELLSDQNHKRATCCEESTDNYNPRQIRG